MIPRPMVDSEGAVVAANVAVVAIGGLDPGGGAGVVRDFLTARTLGAGVRLIPTAWTEQSERAVEAIEPRDPHALALAVRGALVSAGRSTGHSTAETRLAVKIGLLPDGPAIRAVLSALVSFAGPVVLDPVLRASSGGALYSGDPAALLDVGVRATLITPNADEAAALTGLPVRTAEDAVAAGRTLCGRGVAAVLVKGGHLAGTAAVDILVTAGGEIRRFSAERLPGPSVRGTGCALATAIAVGLARGLPLGDAIAAAKVWLLTALAGAVDVGVERHLS